jgi:hypothetical protein
VKLSDKLIVTQDELSKIWQGSITTAHGLTETLMTKPPTTEGEPAPETYAVPTFRFRGSADKDWDPLYWAANFACIGTHPQGFYATWVSNIDLQRMKADGFTRDTRPFPSLADFATTISNFDPLPSKPNNPRTVPSLILNQDTLQTMTFITQKKLDVAENWPQQPTQSDIMGNVGAREVIVPFPRCSSKGGAKLRLGR